MQQKSLELLLPLRNSIRSSLIERRLAMFTSHSQARMLPYDGFESPIFLNHLRELRPTLLINHGAYMENYRTLEYDVVEATRVNVSPLRQVIETFSRGGGTLFVQTGSVFEPGEGGLNADENSGESPYGIVKGMTTKMAQLWCAHFGVSFLKIVIPDPIGPLENEDRLFPVAMRLWKNGETLVLSDPATVRDNIPVTLLAQAYAKKVTQTFESSPRSPGSTFFRPSGMVSSNEMLIRTFASEMESRLSNFKLKARVVLAPSPKAPASTRVNSSSVFDELGLDRHTAEMEFWSTLAREYSH